MSITVEGAPVEELGPDLAALEIDPDLLHVTRAMVEHRTGELVYTRRWLHARPEVSRAEHETTAVLRERLQAEGLAPRLLSVGTGLICDIGNRGPAGGAQGRHRRAGDERHEGRPLPLDERGRLPRLRA